MSYLLIYTIDKSSLSFVDLENVDRQKGGFGSKLQKSLK